MTATHLSTGELALACGTETLVCEALGSCIAVALYHAPTRTGAMAHIMLPGRCPESGYLGQYRYAADAIEHLLGLFQERGLSARALEAGIAGGGNVLDREGDIICAANSSSVETLLAQAGVTIAARSLGGTRRRSLRFEISRGILHLALGDDSEVPFHAFSNHPPGA